jgi:hypothetical protein
MRRLLGIVTAAGLALGAGVALADEASGKIENIDLQGNKFKVGDQEFQWSSENSLGAKLDELKDGDQVKVMYEPNSDGTNDVMEIMKEK